MATIVKDKEAAVLKLRSPSKVTTVIPTAKIITHNNHKLVVVPHRPDETRVLRQLGFSIPDPMKQHYVWPLASGKHNPFDAQIETANFITMHDRCFVLNSMGTGKTVSSLWAYDYMRSRKLIKKALVICPLSTMERTWADEVFRTFPHLDAVVLHGTRERRQKLLEQDAHLYIINVDGLKTIANDLKARTDIDLVIIDEVAIFRNANTTRWKTLNNVLNNQVKARRAWALTGMPTPNSPLDAWAQCKLIVPTHGLVPKYIGTARAALLKQITAYKWVPKKEANDIVKSWMQPSIRFSLDDCTDLPPQMFISRDVEMSDEQKGAYKDMVSKLRTEFAGGEIKAVNEAVKIGKLLQIACGVVYGDNGSPVVLPSKSRIDVLKEVIEESEGKVLVFVPFTAVLNHVAHELSQSWAVRTICGSTSKTERDDIIKEFQNSTTPHVLVANPGTMSHGLTLTKATTIVWYGVVHSNDTYEQACARVRRPGQTRTTVIVHIASSDVERKAYSRLKNKQTMQGLLLDMMKEF